ncbi:MAG: hypothetical protein R3C03_23765 [Pirellulaceae bacterium]
MTNSNDLDENPFEPSNVTTEAQNDGREIHDRNRSNRKNNLIIFILPLVAAHAVFWLIYLMFYLSAGTNDPYALLDFLLKSLIGTTITGAIFGGTYGYYVRTKHSTDSWACHPVLLGMFEAFYFPIIVIGGCMFVGAFA